MSIRPSALLLTGLLAGLSATEAVSAERVRPAAAARPAARIPAARRMVSAAELGRSRAAAPLGRLLAAQRPARIPPAVASAKAPVNSDASALAVLNARFGQPWEVAALNLSGQVITREADGRLRHTLLKSIPNSQSFTEYTTYWRPAETGFELLVENSGVEGEMAARFNCAPNVKCAERVEIFHLNSVTSQETSRKHDDSAGLYYMAAAPNSVDRIFESIDTAYTWLQTHP